MIGRIVLIGFILNILVSVPGCKDVVQKPLSGRYKLDSPDRVVSIVGSWSGTGELGSIELDVALNESDGVDDFRLIVSEGGESYYGEAVGAYYKDKIIISLDLQTVRIQEGNDLANIFNFAKSNYALFGGYFVDGNLHIIPADMEVFREEMADHFSVSGELSTSCNKIGRSSAKLCNLVTSNVHVLSLNVSEYFKKAVLAKFDQLFPLEDVVVLNKVLK
jgi:hypothetical protein